MFIAFLAGIAIGFILAIPPGPVAVSSIKLGINQGLKPAVLLGLGNTVVDFFYCLITIFTTSAFVVLLRNISDKYPVFVLFFQIVVVVAIILYGFTHIRIKKSEQIDESLPKRKSELYNKLTHRGPFLFGIAIALTNIANPVFLPSLASVTMSVHRFNIIDNTVVNNFIFSMGFGLGNFLWLYLLVRVLLQYKSKLSDLTLARIHQFAGFTFIGFGTLLGYRVFTLTKWPEIISFLFSL